MRESRSNAELFLDFFKRFDILRGHSNRVFAFPIRSQVVEFRGKSGRVGDIVAVNVHESEERLHLSDCRRTGPLCEDSKLRGIGRDIGSGYEVTEIEHLISKQRTFRGLELQALGANAIEN